MSMKYWCCDSDLNFPVFYHDARIKFTGPQFSYLKNGEKHELSDRTHPEHTMTAKRLREP